MRARHTFVALIEKGLANQTTEGTQLKCIRIISKGALWCYSNRIILPLIFWLMLIMVSPRFHWTDTTSLCCFGKWTERTHLDPHFPASEIQVEVTLESALLWETWFFHRKKQSNDQMLYQWSDHKQVARWANNRNHVLFCNLFHCWIMYSFFFLFFLHTGAISLFIKNIIFILSNINPNF